MDGGADRRSTRSDGAFATGVGQASIRALRLSMTEHGYQSAEAWPGFEAQLHAQKPDSFCWPWVCHDRRPGLCASVRGSLGSGWVWAEALMFGLV